ncbi:hypothetical protein F6V25_07720 [Oryzomonas japonica]|uniref:Uncharacterized protein n=1 Tax=Oryzomonas japonica TaxID=2603858 RepID=A0A7J4ZQY4_9BACT|nr:hypothetical protein [Oryzomonas japonica]KAB0665602.1 hypothetical protein F6V25_07720 [Oryzomonas japonica]
MRILFTTMLFLILCPLAGAALADDRSDCLNACASDKRSNDMYCPPAGGYSDEDHRQCLEKNAAAYGECAKACSPAPEPPPATAPEPPPAPADPPPAPPEGAPAGDK